MKHSSTTLLAAAIGLGFASSAIAAVPHTFSSGSPAVASEVNANFSNLDGRITTNTDNHLVLEGDLESLSERVESLETTDASSNVYQTEAIDCDENSAALATALSENRNTTTRFTYNVSGACDAIAIERNDVKIVGDGTASIAYADNVDYESVYIDAQSNVRIENIALAGNLYAKNSSSVRLSDVVFAPAFVDDSGDEMFNLYINSSYLRIQSGSLNNVNLRGNRNSTIDIKSSVSGMAPQAIVDGNSTMIINSDSATFGVVEAISNSFIYADQLNAQELISEGSSMVEAESLTLSDRLEAWGNARIAVWGDADIENDTVIVRNSSLVVDGNFTSGGLQCQFSSSMEFKSDVTTDKTLSWDQNNSTSVDIHKGCFAQVNGSYTFNAGIVVGPLSSFINSQWNEVVDP